MDAILEREIEFHFGPLPGEDVSFKDSLSV